MSNGDCRMANEEILSNFITPFEDGKNNILIQSKFKTVERSDIHNSSFDNRPLPFQKGLKWSNCLK